MKDDGAGAESSGFHDPTHGASEPAGPVSDPAGVRLSLLSGFQLLIDDDVIDVPVSSQRVVAFIGLHGPQLRTQVARTLWHEVSDQRAVANLRAALWKLHATRERVIAGRAGRLYLRHDVSVDVVEVMHTAREIVGAGRDPRACEPAAPADVLELLSNDILPDWDDDWVVFERERVRQLRIHAIEALSVCLRRHRRHAEAVEAGLAAVAADPLRESAQRVLIEAHLAEGNEADARRQFQSFSDLIWRDLGVRPSPALGALLTTGSAEDGVPG